MKSLVIAVSLVTLASITLNAWEFPNNPDRFMSLGLNLTSQSAEGEWESPTHPEWGNQDTEARLRTLIFDVRIPVSNSTTFNVAVGTLDIETESDRTFLLYAEKEDMKGGIFQIGFRHYLNK